MFLNGENRITSLCHTDTIANFVLKESNSLPSVPSNPETNETYLVSVQDTYKSPSEMELTEHLTTVEANELATVPNLESNSEYQQVPQNSCTASKTQSTKELLPQMPRQSILEFHTKTKGKKKSDSMKKIKKENSNKKRPTLIKRQAKKKNPVAMRTGELTLKIFSDKSACQRQSPSSTSDKKEASILPKPSSSSSCSPQNGTERPHIEIDDPSDCCPLCGLYFAEIAIRNSFICMKTGNVAITCHHCSSSIVMRHAFKRTPSQFQ